MAAPVQIFISYARADNKPPPDEPGVKGFVTALYEQLEYELGQLGAPEGWLWRDKRIDDGDQFEPHIDAALAGARILLVVLSRRWIQRPRCRWELDQFARRFAGEGETAQRRRIVVVGKNDVERDARPALLKGQVGYNLFEIDRETGGEIDFFHRGRIVNDGYKQRVTSLARYLWDRVHDLAGDHPAAPGAPTPPAAAAPDALGTQRTVYLAHPAADMVAAADSVAAELTQRGYRVVPAAAAELSRDGAEATQAIDAALAEAEVSIHLLGNRLGFTPDGAEPIVRLQLQRAAARCPPAAGATPAPPAAPRAAPPDPRTFHRLIWAPRSIPDGAAAAARDPQEVLARLQDAARPEEALRDGDKLVGDALADFVQFLIQHLEATAPRAAPPAVAAEVGTSIYLTYQEVDLEAAVTVAESLQRMGLVPLLPAFDGELSERQQLHRRNLRDCDAIVLCWAQATDFWVKATASELRRWQELDRDRPFRHRGVIVLPPPRSAKHVFSRIPPRTDIDVVIDASDTALEPAALEARLGPLRGAEP